MRIRGEETRQEDPLGNALRRLDRTIRELEHSQEFGDEKQFRAALEDLYQDLVADKEHQKKKWGTRIENSPVYIIANETVKLINLLNDKSTEGANSRSSTKKPDHQSPDEKLTAKLNALRQYEGNCKKSLGFARFLNRVGTVICTAVGVLLGAVVGAAIGYAIGAWSGPGGIVTAAMGLVKGASLGTALSTSGISLGLATGTASTGLLGGLCSGFLCNRSNQLTRRLNHVVKTGHQFYDRKAGERLATSKLIDWRIQNAKRRDELTKQITEERTKTEARTNKQR